MRVILVTGSPAANIIITIDGSNELPGRASLVSIDGGYEHANERNEEEYAADDICAAAISGNRRFSNIERLKLDVTDRIRLCALRKLFEIEVVRYGTHGVRNKRKMFSIIKVETDFYKNLPRYKK